MTPAVADHENDFYDTARRAVRDMRHVQVDYHAARAVWIYRVSAGFLPFRSEIGLAPRSKAVAVVITLGEMSPPVENLDASHNGWWTVRKIRWGVRGDTERVLALEGRVGASEIVPASRLGQTAQRW
jgi:hypothetical protein